MVLALLATVAAAIWTQTSSSAPSNSRPISYSQHLSHVSDIARSTHTPAAALAAARARVSTAEVRSAAIVKPPPPHNGAGTWLHFVVSAPAADQRSIHAQWLTSLVAGVVADAVAQAHSAPPITGTTIDIALPNGTIKQDQGGGIGLVAAGQQFSGASNNSIRSSLQAKLAATGMKLVSLNVQRVDQPAPDLVVESDNPQAAARSAQSVISSLFLTADHRPIYEGYYFKVVDRRGRSVLIQATSFRTGAGNLWFRPDVAGALSLRHG